MLLCFNLNNYVHKSYSLSHTYTFILISSPAYTVVPFIWTWGDNYLHKTAKCIMNMLVLIYVAIQQEIFWFIEIYLLCFFGYNVITEHMWSHASNIGIRVHSGRCDIELEVYSVGRSDRSWWLSRWCWYADTSWYSRTHDRSIEWRYCMHVTRGRVAAMHCNTAPAIYWECGLISLSLCGLVCALPWMLSCPISCTATLCLCG